MNDPSPPASNSDDAFLCDWLAARDAPCPNCRYTLRGLKVPRCPECGQSLVLRVGLEYPRAAALITGVAGLASGLGFHTMVLIWGLSQRATGREFIPLYLGVITCAALLSIWVRAGRRIRSLSAQVRWGLAILCFVPGIVFFLVFVNRL